MKKYLLLTFLVIQSAIGLAHGHSVLNSNVIGHDRIKCEHINKFYKVPAENVTWKYIGNGKWTDPVYIWNETGNALEFTVKFEVSSQSPFVFRLTPEEQYSHLFDNFIVHCENPQKVFIEPYKLLESGSEIWQIVEENGLHYNQQSLYGTYNNGIINIPKGSFAFTDSKDFYTFDDNGCKIVFPSGYSLPKRPESGVYMGLIAFNNIVTERSISQLNKSTRRFFTNFVDNMKVGNATLLYKAVDKAIDNLCGFTFPADISNIVIITFTDGVDKGSLSGTSYLYNSEYASYLSDRITNTKIDGHNIQSYTIGLKSSGVGDEDEFMYNLKTLASKSSSVNSEFVTVVKNTKELEDKFIKIYENLTKQISQSIINVSVPMMEHQEKFRFTLDYTKKAEDVPNSKIYFEGVFNKINNTIENLILKGFKSSCGGTISVKNVGNNITFSLNDCRDLNGNIFKLENDAIAQWKYIASRKIWQYNRENESGEDVKTEIIKSSLGIVLALDASTSLQESEDGDLFPQVKSTAKHFIDLFAGEVSESGIETPLIYDDSSFEITDPDIEIYNLQGIRVQKPSSGIFICKKGNKVKKFIVR